jgi:hypothetical protein
MYILYITYTYADDNDIYDGLNSCMLDAAYIKND